MSATVSSDVKNYLQFCITFGITEKTKSLTRVICSSTSLIDHILASLPERISQEGVINVGLSDHQFIHCTQRISRMVWWCAQKDKFRLLKNYAVNVYKNALKKINFSNCQYFEDVNRTCSDF